MHHVLLAWTDGEAGKGDLNLDWVFDDMKELLCVIKIVDFAR